MLSNCHNVTISRHTKQYIMVLVDAEVNSDKCYMTAKYPMIKARCTLSHVNVSSRKMHMTHQIRQSTCVCVYMQFNGHFQVSLGEGGEVQTF